MSWATDTAAIIAPILGFGGSGWLVYRARTREIDRGDRDSDADIGRQLRDELRAELDRRDEQWRTEVDRLHADNEQCLRAQAELRTQMGTLEREFDRCHQERAAQAAQLEHLEAELRRWRPRWPFTGE